MEGQNAIATTNNPGRKLRCRFQAGRRAEAPSHVRDEQDESSVRQTTSPAQELSPEPPTDVAAATVSRARHDRRCRSPRSPKARNSLARRSSPQKRDAGALSLVQRLEAIDRGLRPIELAALLGVGKSTLYDWVEAGTIPAYRHRGVIFFDPALIAAWLRRQATQGSSAV